MHGTNGHDDTGGWPQLRTPGQPPCGWSHSEHDRSYDDQNIERVILLER